MSHDIVALSDVCEFLDSQRVPITESDRKPGPYPYYGANGQQDSIDGYIFDEPLVLLAEDGGYFGSNDRPIAYKVTGKCWVNNHAHVLRPKSNIDIDYLHRVLSYYDVTKYINGTTRQKLTKGNAEDITFPLPSLPEQGRIAGLLSRADRLRGLRRVGDDLSGSLLQSEFLEMFGDPVRNEKGWDVYYLAELCESSNGIKAGPFGSSLKKEIYTKSGYRIYGQEQVIGGSFAIGDYYISQEMFEKDFLAYAVKPNDVLISLVGTFGKTIIVPEGIVPGIINPRLVKISPRKDKLNSVYLAQYLQLSSVQKQFLDLSHGGTMGILNAGQLKEFKIVCPSLPEQERFSMVVRQVEALRRRQVESARQGEGLFDGLLS